jgi:hypothetical protein
MRKIAMPMAAIAAMEILVAIPAIAPLERLVEPDGADPGAPVLVLPPSPPVEPVVEPFVLLPAVEPMGVQVSFQLSSQLFVEEEITRSNCWI